MVENGPDQERSLYTTFGFILIILGIVGQINSISTLPISLVMALVLFGLSFLLRRHFTLYLIDFWILAYIYLFFSEYIGLNLKILLGFSQSIRNISEGFIVASFGASLLGYGFVIRTIFIRFVYSKNFVLDQPIPQGDNFSLDVNQYSRSEKRTIYETMDRTRSSSEQQNKEPIPGFLSFFLLGMSAVVLYYIFEGVGLEALLFSARLQQSPFTLMGSVANIFVAIVVTFPIIVAFVLTRYKLLSPFVLIWIVAVALLSILAMIASGTRLFLGFQLGGLLFFLTRGFRFDRRRFVLFVFLVLTIIGLQVIMRYTRDIGIGNASAAELFDITKQANNYLTYEGILSVNALIHATRAYNDYNRIPESLFILYWWVPRQLWPEKPTMAGYWLIRKLSSERNYSSGHSVDGGFAMPALLDFGPIWGVFFCTLYGVGIAILEVFMWLNRDLQRPSAIFAALFSFGVFFMMRSLHTSLIFMTLALFVSVIPLQILNHLFPSRRKQKYDKSVEHLRSRGI